MLICYQMDTWKFLKSIIFYFQGLFFYFHSFAKTIEWMTYYPDYIIQLYYRTEYEEVPTELFATSNHLIKEIIETFLSKKDTVYSPIAHSDWVLSY